MEDLQQRAKQIISQILYITIATVSPQGNPWNSPVYSAFDDEYNFYWGSWLENEHSKNILNNENVFIVIYDSKAPEGTGEGVYIKAKAYSLEDENEIQKALELLDKRAGSVTKPDAFKEYIGNSPRRIFKAVPEKFWMNGEGDKDGFYIDVREEIKLI